MKITDLRIGDCNMKTNSVLKLLDSLNIAYRYNQLKIPYIIDFCNLDEIKDYAITWIKNFNENSKQLIDEHEKTLFFISWEDYSSDLDNVIFVKNLKCDFFRLIEELFKERNIENLNNKIEPSATVLTKNIGQSVYIGHGSIIDKTVKIGNNVKIMHNVVIQGNVEIGDNTFIESGAIIGVCGYGVYDNEDGHSVILPHLGGIKIGKHVRVGAGTCIARGCLCDTVIEDYVKIDNLCHIAHNVLIKQDAKIVACSEISGGVVIGEKSWVAPNTSIKQHVVLGKDVFTGLASNILKDVPDHALVYGNPAKVKE